LRPPPPLFFDHADARTLPEEVVPRLRCSLPLCLLALVACDMEPPGELVGEYAIRGTLLENTCGDEALPANERLDFTVQIRDDGVQALWLLNPPARPGTLADDGQFDFESESLFPVESSQVSAPVPFTADPEAFTSEEDLERLDPASAASNPCTLVIVERMRGSIFRDLEGPRSPEPEAESEDEAAEGDATIEPLTSSDLIANNEIIIRAASGSNCSLVMQAQGGPFETLPCQARYDVEGDLLQNE
jgi:hypothetical protein